MANPNLFELAELSFQAAIDLDNFRLSTRDSGSLKRFGERILNKFPANVEDPIDSADLDTEELVIFHKVRHRLDPVTAYEKRMIKDFIPFLREKASHLIHLANTQTYDSAALGFCLKVSTQALCRPMYI